MCKTLRLWRFSVSGQKPPRSLFYCLEILLAEKMKCHHHLVLGLDLFLFYLQLLLQGYHDMRLFQHVLLPTRAMAEDLGLADGDSSPAHAKISTSSKGGKAEDHHSLTQLAVFE